MKYKYVLLFVCIQITSHIGGENSIDVIDNETSYNFVPVIVSKIPEGIIPSQNIDISEFQNKCPDLEYQNLDSDCIYFLEESLIDDPIWAHARFYHYGLYTIDSYNLKFNSRSKVEFSYGDFSQEYPSWGDILDSGFKDRSYIVEETLQKPNCANLNTLSSGIEPQHIDECKAHDLYKYATYLDFCISFNILNEEQSIMRSAFGGPRVTLYTESLNNIRNAELDDKIFKEQYEMQFRANLTAMWVSYKCLSTVEIIDTVLSHSKLNTNNNQVMKDGLQDRDIRRSVKKAHDEILRVAAKAGNKWAQQSYLPVGEGDAYWKDLFDVNPLLVHRFLSSSFGSLYLSEIQKDHHIVTVRRMLTEQFPDVENFHFRYPTLQSSEHYLAEGFTLVFPWDDETQRTK